MLKKSIKALIEIFVSLVLIFAIYLVLMTVTDYKPAPVIKVNVENNKEAKLKKGDVVSLITFNIGYCGMDKKQDFFMDGGKGSRSTSREKTIENMNGITDFLKNQDNDIMILQEIDEDATRSFNINEYDYLKSKFTDYSTTFALNYKVPWVPLPVMKPMGSVRAGLVTLSKLKVDSSNRYQYPGFEKWPIQLADLDRCFIESRIAVEGGKELVVINSHLSAYDKGGAIRKQQLGFLKKYITDEYSKGNYVIVGGDWNHQLPGTDPLIFKTTESWPDWLQKLPEDFKPDGFNWVVDKSVPTTRTDAFEYKKDVNFLAIIDGYLVSPNIEVKEVKGYNLEFEYTDHNPVSAKVKLK